MKPDARDAARVACQLLRRTGLAGGLSSGGQRGAGLLQGMRDFAVVETLRLVGRRLAASATVEHRAVATALSAALDAGNPAAALEMAATAGLRPDFRAEKIVSRRYGFLWICNPKVASRSIISALRSADPDAELIRERTLSEVAAARPEVRRYVSFAFVRHPCARIFSCYADKFTLARSQAAARPRFIERFHGIRPTMSFVEFCRWLNTACGSDAFANRHWLSQHLQIRGPDGRLPDFIGSYERLDADWETVCRRVGLPYRHLPRLNRSPAGMPAASHVNEEANGLLRRRYADDFRVLGYR